MFSLITAWIRVIYFPTLDQYKLSPAISVQAVEGAPVVSAVNGTVYSIENNAQTGTTVTMELGNGYQAIYGQLTDLDVAEGDTVTKGSIIGYVAAPTIYYSEEGSNLYFAMKKDGEQSTRSRICRKKNSVHEISTFTKVKKQRIIKQVGKPAVGT